MLRKQRCFASSRRSHRGKMPNDDTQQNQKKTVQVKRKGTKRWPRVMPSNSLKQHSLMPQRQLPNSSKSFEYDAGTKKSFMKRLRVTVRKMFSFYPKASKTLQRQGNSPPRPATSRGNSVPSKHHLLPRTIREFSYPKVFPKLKKKLSQNAIQLDVDIVEEHAESLSGTNTVVQARRMTRRISVVSLPPGIRKASYPAKKESFSGMKKKKNMSSMWYHSDMTVGKLQMQVDNLLDNISEKSIQLLALRSAELQRCESLGDKILQSSKQFQRVSLRTTKKHKLKNTCFPCRCCC